MQRRTFLLSAASAALLAHATPAFAQVVSEFVAKWRELDSTDTKANPARVDELLDEIDQLRELHPNEYVIAQEVYVQDQIAQGAGAHTPLQYGPVVLRTAAELAELRASATDSLAREFLTTELAAEVARTAGVLGPTEGWDPADTRWASYIRVRHDGTQWSDEQAVFYGLRDDFPGQLSHVKRVVLSAPRVRASGYGHSASDATVSKRVATLRIPITRYGSARDDVATLLPADYLADLNDGLGEPLRAVSAFHTVYAVNRALWAAGRVLPTMGSFDGQTLGGVLSTGTHGSGGAIGAIVDYVRSFILVTCIPGPDGERTAAVFQIEARNGPTSPTKFGTNSAKAGWWLLKNDGLFDAVCAGVGCMGVIAGVVIETRPAHLITERRSDATWGWVRDRWDKLFGAHDRPDGLLALGHRRELLVVPYPNRLGTSDPTTAETYCQIIRRQDVDMPSNQPRPKETELADRFSKLEDCLLFDLAAPDGDLEHPYRNAAREASRQRDSVGRRWRSRLRKFLTLGMSSDADPWHGLQTREFTSAPHHLLVLGGGWRLAAAGIEVNVPYRRAVAAIDAALHAGAELARVGDPLTTPIGIRFAWSDGRARLLPHARQEVGLSCTIEVGMVLEDLSRWEPHLKHMQDVLVAFEGRVHWGLHRNARRELLSDYDKDDKDLVGRWRSARATLDPFRVFVSTWTNTFGLTSTLEPSPDADIGACRQRLRTVIVDGEGHEPA